jgi:hypothetical protein
MKTFLVFTLSSLALAVLQIEGYRLKLYIAKVAAGISTRTEDWFPPFKRSGPEY